MEGRSRRLYLNANLQVVFAVTLTAVMGVATITPAFPSMSQALGVTPEQVSLLITAFTLPGVLLTPVLGVAADRLGRREVLVPSLLLFGFAGCACAFMRQFYHLLILRFLQGVGGASLGFLNLTTIGDTFLARDRTTAMAYNASVMSVGTALYPMIGGALAMLGWFYPFFLPLFALPVAVFAFLVLHTSAPKTRRPLRGYLRDAVQLLRNWQVFGLFFAGTMTFLILYGAYMSYLPFLLADSFGLLSVAIGLIMSSMAIFTVVGASLVNRLAGRIGLSGVLKMTYAMYALALVAIPFCPSMWLLLIPIALFGLAHGLNIPSRATLVADSAPYENRAGFMSLSGMMLRLGQTLGPPLMGVAAVLGGIGSVFWVGAAFAIVTGFVALLTIGSTEDASQPSPD